uniref:Uncharacterized protein n=1 Tax=Anguilla anguilla TaxID=7936 RepID=A0A0E9T992_ANGAN
MYLNVCMWLAYVHIQTSTCTLGRTNVCTYPHTKSHTFTLRKRLQSFSLAPPPSLSHTRTQLIHKGCRSLQLINPPL